MNDASSIHDNMAGIGGGIFSSAGTLTGAVAGGSVYGNIPDEITVV
jgi:hypothetical protein